MQKFMGIDPGKSGGVGVVGEKGNLLAALKVGDSTWVERADALRGLVDGYGGCVTAYLEAVHAMPKQGVSSTFRFGQDFGFWIGVLSALEVPYQLVSPSKWQRSIGCLTGGNKTISRQAAHQLWPDHSRLLTNATADACLIAEYGRRKELAA